MNKAIIIGRLGRDPEVKHTQSSEAVANLSVATSEKWTDKASGERKERTEWHRVTLWGKLADIAGKYLNKGDQVCIEGEIQTRKWQDKDGQDRYTTEIRGRNLEMLGSASKDGDGESSGYSADDYRKASGGGGPQGGGDLDDEIPFAPEVR